MKSAQRGYLKTGPSSCPAGRRFHGGPEGIVSLFEKFRESWLRPALFFGNNPISLAGGAITTASGITMISYWLAELAGQLSDNPYLGIIFFLILPALFLLGLALIPIGIFLRRRKLQTGRADSRRISQDRSQRSRLPPRHRHRAGGHDRQLSGGGDGQLSRRGIHGFAAVLRPLLPRDEAGVHGLPDLARTPMWPASSATSAPAPRPTSAPRSTAPSSSSKWHFIPLRRSRPKSFPTIPRRFLRRSPACAPRATPARPATRLRASTATSCWSSPSLPTTRRTPRSQTVLILHLGGVDSLSHYTGIHGVHLGHIEYIATDSSRTTIPWVRAPESRRHHSPPIALCPPGSAFPRASAASWTASTATTAPRTPLSPRKKPSTRPWPAAPSAPICPGSTKRAWQLLKATYASQEQASVEIPQQLEDFYRQSNPDVLAAKARAGESRRQGTGHALQPECVSRS